MHLLKVVGPPALHDSPGWTVSPSCPLLRLWSVAVPAHPRLAGACRQLRGPPTPAAGFRAAPEQPAPSACPGSAPELQDWPGPA